MRKLLFLAIMFVFVLSTDFAEGHGTPIQIGVAGSALVVSGGLPDGEGFASMIFLEDDEDGEPFGTVVHPQFGSIIVWQLPGLDISGMNDPSSLSLQVISRPVKFVLPVEERVLWYANSETEVVMPALADFRLLGTGMRSITLSPTDDIAPPPFLLANSVAGQQGFHNHGLLAYALDNDPVPPAGAYGFFARFTSNQYAPSDPFLVVFNHDVTEYSQMTPAALAINAAAFLPGDYNHDDRVDAADYVVWRKTFGSTTQLAADSSGNKIIDEADYDFWRRNFGATIDSAGSSLASVPEPATLVLLMFAVTGLVVRPVSTSLRREANEAR